MVAAPAAERANPHGRRVSDHLKWWVLVVSALLQGGFALAHRWTLEAWERQVTAEREQRQRQHDDLMRLYGDNRDDLRALTKEIGTALGVVRSQAEAQAQPQSRPAVVRPLPGRGRP